MVGNIHEKLWKNFNLAGIIVTLKNFCAVIFNYSYLFI